MRHVVNQALGLITCQLFSQIGRLRDSMSDLKSALSLQPTLSDILWHRHLLHLIQGNEQLALDDLNSLLKCNKKHFGAYRSRMDLLLRRGDTSKAVFNLTQAIALQPKDAEMYFMRAELFEKVTLNMHKYMYTCTPRVNEV